VYVDVDVRVLGAIGGEQVGQEAAVADRLHRHDQPGFRFAGPLRGPGGACHRGQCCPALVQQGLAGGGELDRAAGAFQQRDAEAAYRAVELAGDRREEVVAAYRARWGSGQVGRLLDSLPDPDDHPVFRLDPLDRASRG